MRKPVFGISNQVGHKLDCMAAEDGQRLQISEEEGVFYICSKTKSLISCVVTAGLGLCFRLCTKTVFS